MNSKHLLLLALQLPASLVLAEATPEKTDENGERIRYQLILPDEKTPEVIKPNEPNPFNKGDGSIIQHDESTSEENRVKDMLLSMRPSGLVRNGDGTVRCVMLGDMRLERGMIVPPVVADQEVNLRVNSVSDTTIELFWIEKKRRAGLPPRPVIIPIDLDPAVRYILPKPGSQPHPVKSGKGEKGGSSFGRQSAPLLSAQLSATAPETRRAEVVEDKGGAAGDSGAPAVVNNDKTATPPPQPKMDEKHPANLLFNLLRNKAEPAQQQTPKQ